MPVLNPGSYGVISIFFASARRSENSSLPFFTNISPEEDGTIVHLSGPAATPRLRSFSLRVIVFFLPAMIHFPLW